MRSKCGEIDLEILYYSARNIPAKVTNISLRTMKATQVEDLLNLIESILLHSKVLLRSANTLSHSLIRAQIPAKKLTIETDGIRLDANGECNRQDLDALLEPCGTITPDRSQNSTQAGGSSDNVTLSPSLSPLLSRQDFLSRSRPRTPTTLVSSLISPAKREIPTVYSTLTSPVKLPTPSFFNDALHTPSIASPSW